MDVLAIEQLLRLQEGVVSRRQVLERGADDNDIALDRWADLDRDLDAAGANQLTVRLGWQQVLQPCRTAEALGAHPDGTWLERSPESVLQRLCRP
ncbi:MAG TPA: hypothetical protein VHO29_04930 [Marmoricola sp.]|nr:hypothetical protein [Marmoricola sp.]